MSKSEPVLKNNSLLLSSYFMVIVSIHVDLKAFIDLKYYTGNF